MSNSSIVYFSNNILIDVKWSFTFTGALLSTVKSIFAGNFFALGWATHLIVDANNVKAGTYASADVMGTTAMLMSFANFANKKNFVGPIPRSLVLGAAVASVALSPVPEILYRNSKNMLKILAPDSRFNTAMQNNNLSDKSDMSYLDQFITLNAVMWLGSPVTESIPELKGASDFFERNAIRNHLIYEGAAYFSGQSGNFLLTAALLILKLVPPGSLEKHPLKSQALIAMSLASVLGRLYQNGAIEFPDWLSGTGLWSQSKSNHAQRLGHKDVDLLKKSDHISADGSREFNIIWGTKNNDHLKGTSLNELMVGEYGSDTYIFERGSGSDRIIDYDPTLGNTDVVLIGPGISAEQLCFRKVDRNLEMILMESTDKPISDELVIANWSDGSENQIEKFVLSNGKALLNSQVDLLVMAWATLGSQCSESYVMPQENKILLNYVIASNWQ